MRCLEPVDIRNPKTGQRMFVPCGKCEECCKDYSLMWSLRMMDELSLSGKGLFITLTYNDQNLPEDMQLRKKDLQDFLKRLRWHIKPEKVRYYACGEYGGKGNRPHYHLCLFGWLPSDLKKRNEKCYVSAQIEEIWNKGFVHIYDLTFETAKYAAKYLSKLDKRPHEVKPFSTCSLKPGLGALTVTPDWLKTGVRYVNGRQYPLPKYYLTLLERSGWNVEPLRCTRAKIAESSLLDVSGARMFRSDAQLRAYTRARAPLP